MRLVIISFLISWAKGLKFVYVLVFSSLDVPISFMASISVTEGAEYLRSCCMSIPKSSHISRATMLAMISCAIMYFLFSCAIYSLSSCVAFFVVLLLSWLL